MNRNSVILFSMILAVISLPVTVWSSDKHKEMDKGEIKYIERSDLPWDKRGRIVGELDNPPEKLTIEFYSVSQNKKLYTYTAPGEMNIYMSKFLPPGTYKLTFKSPGYSDFIIRSVKVRAGFDCFIDIKFGRKVFINR